MSDTETLDPALINETIDDDDDDDKGNLLATLASNIFLFFLIFGLSATVEIKNLKKQLTNKFAIGCGVAMQFFIMPVLGYLAVLALDGQGLTQAMGVTLLVVTSSPGGSYSNWWCSTFNADLALSVAMTTVSSLMSIGMLPANLLLYSWLAYGSDEDESLLEALDFTSIFISLGIVLTAIISGLACGYKWDNARFHEISNKLGSISGLCLILFGLFVSSGGDGAESNIMTLEWSFYIGVAFPCLVGIALANIISRSLRLSPPETVAISIECCYQNTGIATSVAISMYDDVEERAQAVAVPIFYGIVEAVAIGLYCVWAWKVGWTKAPADEKFCTVITKSYEINHDEEHDHASDDDGDDEVGTAARDPSQFENENSVINAMAQTTAQPPPRSFWQRFLGRSSNSAPEMPKTTDGFTTPTKRTRGRGSAQYTGDTLPATPQSTDHLFNSERTSL
mmetsp:Transcript_19317/g.39170  ORF Transcript_19317/g.39170 Transcript_19317/m.39170 type:complete len:452 (-) Transcript_19317:112-1467(-)